MNILFPYWHFDIILTVFFVALCVFYMRLVYAQLHKRMLYFVGGLLVFIVAVFSPLEFIAMHYLFSAHMISHVLLLLVIPPLMTTAIPRENRYKGLLQSFSKKMAAAPFLSWLTGVGIMWFWHVPAVYRYMMNSHEMANPHEYFNIVTVTHTLSLWFAGIIFCWPLTGPYRKYRLPELHGILYLATACISCSLLGLLLTFAPAGLYGHMIMADKYGIGKMIYNDWGITSRMDQQMAGLIMWVPCCFIYLTWALILLKKWFSEKEENYHANNLNPREI